MARQTLAVIPLLIVHWGWHVARGGWRSAVGRRRHGRGISETEYLLHFHWLARRRRLSEAFNVHLRRLPELIVGVGFEQLSTHFNINFNSWLNSDVLVRLWNVFWLSWPAFRSFIVTFFAHDLTKCAEKAKAVKTQNILFIFALNNNNSNSNSYNKTSSTQHMAFFILRRQVDWENEQKYT